MRIIESEIYEIYHPDDRDYEPWADYEVNIISVLMDEYEMDPEDDWKTFLSTIEYDDDKHGLRYRKYPYYIENSKETINVQSNLPGEGPHERSLMVEGMHRHTKKQLDLLRKKEVYTITELSQIEDW